MITGIRIRNLRSLKDTGDIQLKKLNILLGVNSSGKSTFLRSFPLLKQSINRDLRNAISWYDSASVDFGDYATSINREAKGEPISFEFIISKPFNNRFLYFYSGYYAIKNSLNQDDSLIKVRIDYREDSSGTYVQKVTINDGVNECAVISKDRASDLSFVVNGREQEEEFNGIRFGRYLHSQLVPLIEFYDKNSNRRGRAYDAIDYMREKIRSRLKKYCNRHLKKIARLDEVIDLWDKDKRVFLNKLKQKLTITSFKKNAQSWSVDSQDFVDIYSRILCLQVIDYLEFINNEVTLYFSNCSYIAPVRAEAIRYYREQGLQVEDIDPYGKNLQEFISSLNNEMADSYKNYCIHVLGVYPVITPFGGQNSISLRSPDSELTNLTDVGFGYSQILPIVTKLWYATQAFTPTGSYLRNALQETVLIEQPELHLHPAMQAKIADALIECALQGTKQAEALHINNLMNDSLSNYCVIVETHSSSIVNRIGRRIREGKLSPDDVSIILFEKKLGEDNTIVKQIGYNEEGRLMDWPYGFFEPND